MTLTKRLRIYDFDKDAWERGQPIKGFRNGMTRGAMVKRPVRLPAEPRKNAGNCYHCGLPVWVSEGQVIIFAVNKNGKFPTHKPCRKMPWDHKFNRK